MSDRYQLFYAVTILFVIALGLSKCSIVALLMRMTRKKRQLQVFRATLAALAAWTVASTFATALQCNLRYPWILVGERCPGLVCQGFLAISSAASQLTSHLSGPAVAGFRSPRCHQRTHPGLAGPISGVESSTVQSKQSYGCVCVQSPCSVSIEFLSHRLPAHNVPASISLL